MLAVEVNSLVVAVSVPVTTVSVSIASMSVVVVVSVALLVLEGDGGTVVLRVLGLPVVSHLNEWYKYSY